MKGTVALSWGPYGGFYLHRHRICLGWVALTYVPRVEIDDLMEAWLTVVEQHPLNNAIEDELNPMNEREARR